MSCSVWLEEIPGTEVASLYDGITYNLSAMFQEATGGLRFTDMGGRSGAECGRILRAALQRLVSDPERFEVLNPPNGWGDYDGLVQETAKAAIAAARYPNAVSVFSG